ncbi:uncharacterized protein LOC107206010 isoform X2 [Parus major]|uniref:uncharacterized protein LOC107206010 isoform X2 n=1 Tax=Parus major TaxID=9157 RepID=UPI00077150E7|nr:uncharacterized protein LOC107206010 isoform X2 [Parus major]
MTPSLGDGGGPAFGGDGAGAGPAGPGSGAAAMEAPGPPAVRARSRRSGSSAPQRHTRGAGLQVHIGDDSYSCPGEVMQCFKTTTQHCREPEDLCSSFNLDVAKDSVITCNQVISLSFKTWKYSCWPTQFEIKAKRQ